MVAILMMSAKMAGPDLDKIKVFRNKGCEAKIFVQDVTNKILSCDLKYIVYMVI